MGAQMIDQANSHSEGSLDGGLVIVSLSMALNLSYYCTLYEQVMHKRCNFRRFLRLDIPFMIRGSTLHMDETSCRNAL